MSKFTHTFNLCFNVKSDSNDPTDVTADQQLAALALRLAVLMKDNLDQHQDVTEAFGCCDTIES
jgi:hypothetical protein